MDIRKLTALFASSDERPVAVLGNTIAETFLSTGFLGNGFAVLSDKRVYFRGRCFARSGKHFSARKEERVVDVQDITGTGFVFNNPIWIFVLSIILFCGLIFSFTDFKEEIRIISAIGSILLGGIALAIYFSKKQTLFEISFAGGGIAFDVRWFPAEEAQSFQKNIKLISDAVKGQQKQVGGELSVANDLSKLADLLTQGLITREEYEAQKRTLLAATTVGNRETPVQPQQHSAPVYSSQPQASKFCPNCGNALCGNAVFCGKCGARQ